jgi:hypothetical protein
MPTTQPLGAGAARLESENGRLVESGQLAGATSLSLEREQSANSDNKEANHQCGMERLSQHSSSLRRHEADFLDFSFASFINFPCTRLPSHSAQSVCAVIKRSE